MKAKQFVDYLNSLIPLTTSGGQEAIFGRMRIEPQSHPTSYNDELSALINNYDLDGVDIGMVSFLGKYMITDDHYIFAKIDLDFIGFNKKDREIVLLDHDNIGFVIMKCAKDSKSFLQVLQVYSEYTIRRVLNEEPPAINLAPVYDKAGGHSYARFIDFLFYPTLN